jgi:hypothetical protein
MSYETDTLDRYRQVGVYTGQILKGVKPADLPVVQSTKFEFLINLGTAKLPGIEVPETLLATAESIRRSCAIPLRSRRNWQRCQAVGDQPKDRVNFIPLEFRVRW